MNEIPTVREANPKDRRLNHLTATKKAEPNAKDSILCYRNK